MPWLKPVTWVKGDGMSVVSPAFRPQCRAHISVARISVSCVCSTAFGRPVVPDV